VQDSSYQQSPLAHKLEDVTIGDHELRYMSRSQLATPKPFKISSDILFINKRKLHDFNMNINSLPPCYHTIMESNRTYE
jgi:hypothetical protein